MPVLDLHHPVWSVDGMSMGSIRDESCPERRSVGCGDKSTSLVERSNGAGDARVQHRGEMSMTAISRSTRIWPRPWSGRVNSYKLGIQMAWTIGYLQRFKSNESLKRWWSLERATSTNPQSLSQILRNVVDFRSMSNQNPEHQLINRNVPYTFKCLLHSSCNGYGFRHPGLCRLEAFWLYRSF